MKKIAFLTAVTLLTVYTTRASVIYVDVNATGANNGSSWTNAYTDLQTALSIAFINDEIWVATGLYKPTTTLDRDISFVMKNGVNVYGGFAGTETNINQRNISANPTTLSGDIGQLGDNSDNTRKIVRIENFTTNFIMDGFRIVSGYDGSSSGRGAGAYLNNNGGAQITINNCVIYNNYAYREGGGMWVDESNVTYNNCDFWYNGSYNYGGGGIYADNGSNSNIYLYDCSFIGQNSRDGTVITFDGDELVFERCLISNNTCTSLDMISIDNGVQRFEINNSLLIGNLLNDPSGSLVSSYSSAANSSSITNSTICHNRNNSSFTPYSEMIYQSNSAMNIRNCIIYGNTNSDNSVQIDPGNNVENCIVENGYSTGINVLDVDPLFVAPSNLNSAPFDASSFDYSLQSLSSAVNYGNNAYAAIFTTDYAGAARIQQGLVDCGALESPFADLQPPVANCTDTVVYLDNSGIAVIDSSYIDNLSTDNLGITSYALSNTTFSCADLGSNTVQLTVMDASGNSDVCAATVTVVDNTPPSVTLQLSYNFPLPSGGQDTLLLSDILVSSSDNCGIDTITYSPSVFSCSDVGAQTVQVTAVDESGNSVTSSMTVYVMDTVFPVALAVDTALYLSASGNVILTAAEVDAGSYDDCGINWMSLNKTSFFCFDTGVNNVTFTAVDFGGNVTPAYITVTVYDTITPVTIGQNIQVNLSTSNPYVITPGDVDNGSYDNCSITQSLSQTTFSAVGVYDVDLTSTDPSGNSSTVTVQVEVIDSSVGLEETVLADLSIFPNPTSGKVNISTSSFLDRVEVFDLSGVLVATFGDFPGEQIATIDLSAYSAGMYFLDVYSVGDIPVRVKLIKQQ